MRTASARPVCVQIVAHFRIGRIVEGVVESLDQVLIEFGSERPSQTRHAFLGEEEDDGSGVHQGYSKFTGLSFLN